MNLDDIKEILELVHEHDLAEFELERDGLKIRVRKANSHPVSDTTVTLPIVASPIIPAAAVAAPAAPAPAAQPPTPQTAQEEMPGLDLAVIKSPIVGTFYRSSEPGAPPFVDVGDRVKKGQVLCIIEAMKLMNEIECETDGEISAIYVENGQPVQYGDRLFAVKVGVGV